MTPTPLETLRRWPSWKLPFVGAVVCGTAVASASFVNCTLYSKDPWDHDYLPLIGLAGGACAGAYLGFLFHSLRTTGTMPAHMESWQRPPLGPKQPEQRLPLPPLGPKQRERRRRQAKARLLETWRYRAAIFEDLPSEPARRLPWLIVRPNSGAGKPVKSTSFIRQVLEEIRRLNMKKKWWI